MIEVTASAALAELRLESLVGRKGKMIMENEAHTGYFVEFEHEVMGYKEWFIPSQSVKFEKP